MKRSSLSFLAMLLVPLASEAQTVGRSRGAPVRLVVALEKGQDLEDVLAGRASRVHAIRGTNTYLVDVPFQTGQGAGAVQSQLRSNPHVRFVEEDLQVIPPELGGCSVSAQPGAQP